MKLTRLLNSVKKLNSGIYVPETKVLKPTCSNTIVTPNPNGVISPAEQVTVPDDFDVKFFRFAKDLKIQRIYHKKYKILVLNETDFLKAKSIGDGIKSYNNIFSAAFYKNGERFWRVNGIKSFPVGNIMYDTLMKSLPTDSRLRGPEGKYIPMYDRIVYVMPRPASAAAVAVATADATADEEIPVLFSVYPKMLALYGKIHVMDDFPRNLETANTMLDELISTAAAAEMKLSKGIR